jgi:hypothetical protein
MHLSATGKLASRLHAQLIEKSNYWEEANLLT